MSATPAISPDDLSLIPLLRGLSSTELEQITALLEPADIDGDVLFESGTTADAFYLLTKGSVHLFQGEHETHNLHPIVIIGEVGALTGRKRISKAVVESGSEIWQIPMPALNKLFQSNPELGLHFESNLLEILADKLHRDQIRLRDMRANIVHTQKAMKDMRTLLLESEDTVVSKPIHETVEGLIRRNRRVNYRVDPPAALASTLRLDDGTEALVRQISREIMTVDGMGGAEGDRISGVLFLSGPEIPVSGKIVTVEDGMADIKLDLLIEEYADKLEGYLTRVQMLDFLV